MPNPFRGVYYFEGEDHDIRRSEKVISRVVQTTWEPLDETLVKIWCHPEDRWKI